MYNAIFVYVSSHVEEYTLKGVLSKFPDNKERSRVPKKIYWVVYRIEIRERSIVVFQCLAVRDICWTTTVMPQWHLCSHKFNMVSKSHQLLRCMEPGLTLLRLGGTFYLCRFLSCCAKTVHCSSLSSFTLNIGIKYN